MLQWKRKVGRINQEKWIRLTARVEMAWLFYSARAWMTFILRLRTWSTDKEIERIRIILSTHALFWFVFFGSLCTKLISWLSISFKNPFFILLLFLYSFFTMTTLPTHCSVSQVSIPNPDADTTRPSRQARHCQQPVKPTVGILIHPTQTKRTSSRQVSFSLDPPLIYEYEPEHDQPMPSVSFFDEGWPGRAKKAMDSTGFIDFKSKIEAKLSAINHPGLMSQLESDRSVQPSLLSSRYRDRKSPLVEPLSFCPEQDESDTDSSLSPTIDSPLVATPSDSLDTWFIHQPVK